MLSDSPLNSKGIFESYLLSGKQITIENATCENELMGFGASVGFTVKKNEALILELMNDFILKISVFNILKTEFALKKQKKQQRILTCLAVGK